MDFDLNDDQLAYVAAARDFAAGELAPYAAEWDQTAHFPKAALKAAGEMGFMGMYTPESAGGLGMSRLDASLIVEELARGCTTTAAFLTIHNMATNMIGKYCQQGVVDAWCPDLVAGEKLASYCLTEPGAGSDAASLRTRAEREGDHYVVNGSKVFISGAGETDVLVVMTRTGAEGPKGITALLIPADAEGVGYGKKEHKMGWNAQNSILATLKRAPIARWPSGSQRMLASKSVMKLCNCLVVTATSASTQWSATSAIHGYIRSLKVQTKSCGSLLAEN